MPKTISLVGQRFGRLVVKQEGQARSHSRMWICECECGQITIVQGGNLKSGHTKSCGCLSIEITRISNRTHGKTGSSEYNARITMIDRCYNPNIKNFSDYGGRGITVCDRWRESFENFISDMGKKPGKGYSLERINNDGPYEPENCRWATRKEQQRNTRRNRLITFHNKTQPLIAWAEELCRPYRLLMKRLNRGWSIDDAFLLPLKSKRTPH